MNVELIDKIKVIQSFEWDQADSLKPTIDTMKNSLIQTILAKIRLDSMKHVYMLGAIMDLNADQVIWHIDKLSMIEKLNRHLEIEVKMLKGIKDLLDEVNDEKTKPLLREVLSDEERHHRMLTRLADIVESIDVSQEDWIDLYRKRLQEEWPDF